MVVEFRQRWQQVTSNEVATVRKLLVELLDLSGKRTLEGGIDTVMVKSDLRPDDLLDFVHSLCNNDAAWQGTPEESVFRARSIRTSLSTIAQRRLPFASN